MDDISTFTDTAASGNPLVAIVFMVAYFAVIILLIVSVWKIFTKAGQPGWASIIPIYNTIIFLKIVNKPWWWLFIFMIPIVGIVFAIIATHRLSLSFGKGAGYTLGIMFLPFIFFPMLAFGDASYRQLPE